MLLRVVFGGLSGYICVCVLRKWRCGREERGKPYVDGAPEFNLSHTSEG